MFVTYAYIQAGCKALNPKEARYAFCPFWVRDARLGVKGQALLTRDQVKPGDVVLYDWGRDGTSDHVGMFDAWTGDGKFRAIEGNTSPGNESNGGKVMMRDRTIGNVIAFVRAEV